MTTDAPLPHASWADVYDEAYERSFGMLYSQMTARTLEVIAEITAPPASIVDFGAGTGRLSAPLSRSGYTVTAVDPCPEMLEQLGRKVPEVTRTVCTMAAFDGGHRFDLALCVFTVLPYLLDEVALNASFAAAWRALSSGGVLLLDIPSRAVFTSYSFCDGKIRRSVEVVPTTGPFHSYTERLGVRGGNGHWQEYTDHFDLRWWSTDEILRAAEAAGLSCERELSPLFTGTGSRYFLLRRRGSERGVDHDGA
jgi:SAM-dependent methyltransferase